MITIAIYSGEIPSTVFIENLIKKLSNQSDIEIYLFGKLKKNILYKNNNIKIFPTPNHKILLIFHILFYSIKILFFSDSSLLNLFKNKFYTNLPIKKKIYYLAKVLPIIYHSPDILHIQWTKDINELILLKTIYNIKIILSMRGAQINYSPIVNEILAQQYKKNFPFVNHFHAVSNAIVKEAKKYGVSPYQTTVIKPAVDKSIFNIQHQEYKNNQTLKIVSIGRAHWKKGYMYSIDAMKYLVNKQIKFHYTIVSQGKNEELIYQINQLQLNEYITIISGLEHKKVLELVSASDLFLLPSVEEGIANVVLEAMALKTYVISTDCGGMQEVIDGTNGTIIPIRNSNKIADAIIDFLHYTPQYIENSIENGFNTIKNKHLLDHQVNEMYSLYKKVYTK